jgi:hypothetical protein
VKLEAGMRRVELKIEGGRLDRFLLGAGQSREAVGEGVSDPEFHGSRSRHRSGQEPVSDGFAGPYDVRVLSPHVELFLEFY